MAMGYGGQAANTSTILIRFENGATGNSITSLAGGGGILPKHYAEPGIVGNEYHNGFDEEMSMFADLCLNNGTNPMDIWEACIPTVIFEKAVESMDTGRAVPIDVHEEFYLPDGHLPPSIAQFGDN